MPQQYIVLYMYMTIVAWKPGLSFKHVKIPYTLQIVEFTTWKLFIIKDSNLVSKIID